jgi:hypothetical protein
VDSSASSATQGQVATAAPAAAASGTKRKSRRLWLLDAVGTIVWTYAIVKTFVFDFDVYLVQHYLPGAAWIVDSRFLILLVLVALWAAFGRRWWFLAGALYVAFFPLIVIFWKGTRLLFRTRSWVPVFALMDVLSNLIRDYRFALGSIAVGLVSAVVIVFATSRWLLIPAAVLWGGLLAVLFVRAFWRSISPSRFIRGQAVLLDRIVGSEQFSKLWQIKEELRSPAVKKFDSSQQVEFVNNMAMGVMGHRLMYWWAYQLDAYRQSPAPILFTFLSYLRLFVAAVVGFALINAALFRADAANFAYSKNPGAFDFIHYAINTLIAGSVDYLSPKSALALAVSDTAHLTGILFFITLFATALLSIRSSKQDEALRASVEVFRRRAREFDQRFSEQYEVTVAEAMKRLKDLSYGLLAVILYFSSKVPEDFEAGHDKH